MAARAPALTCDRGGFHVRLPDTHETSSRWRCTALVCEIGSDHRVTWTVQRACFARVRMASCVANAEPASDYFVLHPKNTSSALPSASMGTMYNGPLNRGREAKMNFPKKIEMKSWAYLVGVAMAVAVSASLVGSYINGDFGNILWLAR